MPNEVLLGGVKELLAEGRQVVIMTKGVSMLPFIEGKKDSVLLEKRDAPVPGDIALAEISPGKYVLHRVLAVEDGRVALRGDGNYRGEEHCVCADVAGVVVEIQHGDGSSTNPSSPAQLRRWKRWTHIPAIIRRYYLALYRRIKKIQI